MTTLDDVLAAVEALGRRVDALASEVAELRTGKPGWLATLLKRGYTLTPAAQQQRRLALARAKTAARNVTGTPEDEPIHSGSETASNSGAISGEIGASPVLDPVPVRAGDLDLRTVRTNVQRTDLHALHALRSAVDLDLIPVTYEEGSADADIPDAEQAGHVGHVEQEPAALYVPATDDDGGATPGILLKLAHLVLDDVVRGVVQPGDAIEALQARTTAIQLVYRPAALLKALQGAQATRETQTPLQSAHRLIRGVLAAQAPVGSIGLGAEAFRKALYVAAVAQWPTEAFAEWRGAVVTLGWSERTWMTTPGVKVVPAGKKSETRIVLQPLEKRR